MDAEERAMGAQAENGTTPNNNTNEIGASSSAAPAVLNVDLDMKEQQPQQPQRKNDPLGDRETWSGSMDFLVSSLGYAVGLGNVWRFPYMCYRNGGGAFLIPYMIFLIFVGMPLFLIDVSLGQFSSSGPFTCWQYAPFFTGIGYGMAVISSLVSIYYNIIIAYSIYYLFASMSNPLPWVGCNNTWNTPACRDCSKGRVQCTYDNSSKTVLPAEEYFNREVLKLSDDISQMGEVQWKIVLCLFVAWIIVFLCLMKGIKSSGKIVYFTALFPYIVLLILFIRGVLLDGSAEGIRFYIIPVMSRLRDASVWKDAANQIFFSLSASWGGLITLSSYNKFNNNIMRDTIIICISNSATSLFAGFVIFSYLGHLAVNMGSPVSTVAEKGIGLAFIIYPEAVATMPGSYFWSVLFFFMLFLLGLDSQFATIETVITGFVDTYPFFLRPRKTWFILLYCIIFFILGIPLTMNGGSYWLQLMDTYCGGWAILLIGMLEVVSVGWIYGRPGVRWSRPMRFQNDVEVMLGKPISKWWRFCWQWLTPALMAGIIFYSWLDYTRAKYGDKTYPVWADFLGWLMTIVSLIFVPGFIFYLIWKERRQNPYHSWRRILSDLTSPTYKWGPALPQHRLQAARQLEDSDQYYIDVVRLIKYPDYVAMHQLHQNGAADIVAQ